MFHLQLERSLLTLINEMQLKPDGVNVWFNRCALLKNVFVVNLLFIFQVLICTRSDCVNKCCT